MSFMRLFKKKEKKVKKKKKKVKKKKKNATKDEKQKSHAGHTSAFAPNLAKLANSPTMSPISISKVQVFESVFISAALHTQNFFNKFSKLVLTPSNFANLCISVALKAGCCFFLRNFATVLIIKSFGIATICLSM